MNEGMALWTVPLSVTVKRRREFWVGRGTSRRRTGSSADVLLMPYNSNGKDLKVFLFCREEINGSEENIIHRK